MKKYETLITKNYLAIQGMSTANDLSSNQQ